MLPFAKILPKFFNSKVTSRSFVSRSVVRSKSAGHDDHAHHEHLVCVYIRVCINYLLYYEISVQLLNCYIEIQYLFIKLLFLILIF